MRTAPLMSRTVGVASATIVAALALAACGTSSRLPGAAAGSEVRSQGAGTSATSTTAPGATAAGTTAPGTTAPGAPSSASSAPAATASLSADHKATPSPSTGATAPTPTSASPAGGVALPASAGCPTPTEGFIGTAPGARAAAKTVALTFDDGPAVGDLEIGRILAAKHVRATFFEVGSNVAAHPDISRSLVANGQLIAGQSWDHEYPSQVAGGWTPAYLSDQLTRTATAVKRATGQSVCYFRPPGGFRDNVVATAGSVGESAVMWSVDTNDWRQPVALTDASTQAIYGGAIAVGQQSHPIVLMHSTKASHEPDSQVGRFRGNTISALPRIIDWYAAHGYTFVGIDGRTFGA